MKKILLLFVFFCSIILCDGQNRNNINNINININNQDFDNPPKKECPYSINGICITEDIGGVTSSIVYEDDCTWVVFTNYNNFPVNVLYEVKSNYHEGQSMVSYHAVKNGTISNVVLGAKGSKNVKLNQTYCNHPYKAYQGYKNMSDYYSIKAMIARKLSN